MTNELIAEPSTEVTPSRLLEIAVSTGADLDKLEKLMALQERWEANEAKKAFVQEMAAFKANPPEIFKTKKVGYETQAGDFVGYKHATLGDVASAIAQGLGKHGMSHRWDVRQEGNQVVVTCIVTHRKGHSESVTLQSPPDNSGKKNPIQQIASTVSYLERYTLLAITGLAAQDENDSDDDGRSAGGADEPEKPNESGADADRRFHSREAKDERAQKKIERHLKAAAKNAESIAYIKERLAAGDGIAAANEWQALDEWDRVALSLTAEKGGTAFTDEQGRQISAAKAQLAEKIRAEADAEAERAAKEALK